MSTFLHKFAVFVNANIGISRQDEQLFGDEKFTEPGPTLVWRRTLDDLLFYGVLDVLFFQLPYIF